MGRAAALRLLGRLSPQPRRLLSSRGRPWTHAAAVQAGDAAPADAVVYTPIGVFDGPYTRCNGTPRQGVLAPRARGVVRLFDDVLAGGGEAALAGLDGFSHAVLLWCFHANGDHRAAAKVAPPRLSGARVGLFATRSPHRPNAIGLTVVRVDSVAGTELRCSGCDLLAGTPVLDIKPYLPYADSFPDAAVPPWLSRAPDTAPLHVAFAPAAAAALEAAAPSLRFLRSAAEARAAIEDGLRSELRSAYRRRGGGGGGAAQRAGGSDYGFFIDGLDVRCAFDDAARGVTVTSVERARGGDGGGGGAAPAVAAADAAAFSALLSGGGLEGRVSDAGAVALRLNGVILALPIGAPRCEGLPAALRYDWRGRRLLLSVGGGRDHSHEPDFYDERSGRWWTAAWPLDSLVGATCRGHKALRTVGLALRRGPLPGGAAGWLRPGQKLGVAALWDALAARRDLSDAEFEQWEAGGGVGGGGGGGDGGGGEGELEEEEEGEAGGGGGGGRS